MYALAHIQAATFLVCRAIIQCLSVVLIVGRIEKRKADDITGNTSETQARSRVDQATGRCVPWYPTHCLLTVLVAPTSDRVVRSGTRSITQRSSTRRRQADVAKAAAAANSPSSTKPDLPPMIQGGTYAINMLCRAPVTSHAITMVIIGMFDHLQYHLSQANTRITLR